MESHAAGEPLRVITGGPDPVRGIYPTVATITASGFERVPDEEVAERFEALIARRTEAGHQP